MQSLPLVASALLACTLLTSGPARAQDAPTVDEVTQLIATGDLPGAREAAQALVEADPQNGLAWYYLGYCYHALGDLDRALPAHLRAVEVAQAAGDDETADSAAYNAICAYSLRGELDAAFDELKWIKERGWSDLQLLRSDADLENLRTDPRFLEMWPDAAPVEPFAEEDVRVIWSWTGASAREEFGWVAQSAGDVDGDGRNDVIVGAPFFSQPSFGGRCYLYSTATGELIWKRTGEGGDQLGNSVSEGGDLDGDGHSDVIVGAPGYEARPGRAFVLSGAGGDPLLTLPGEQPGDAFGAEVFCAGDLSGDGRPDYLVGAPKHDGEAGADSGRAVLISGASGEVLETFDGERAGDRLGTACAAVMTPSGPWIAVGAQDAGEGRRGRVYVWRGADFERAFVIEGDETAVNYGRFFLSFPGDFDGDGVPDVYSSDWENAASGQNTGRAYVHSSSDGALIRQWTGRAGGYGFGIGNAELGDVNADGVPDLVVGEWRNAEKAAGAGKAYVLSGRDGALLRAITCQIAGDGFGFDAVGLGDVDGDGQPDLLITAAYHGAAGPRSGIVYVIAGR